MIKDTRHKPLSAQLINPALTRGKEKAVIYQAGAACSSALNVAFQCDISMCKFYDSNSGKTKAAYISLVIPA